MMTNQYWFKPKTFGYGATPSSWEGWAVVAAYTVVLVSCVLAISSYNGSFVAFVAAIAAMVVATIVLFVVSVQKTDGAWGWNAGAKQNAGKKN
jgi:uncharacterized membrane protein